MTAVDEAGAGPDGRELSPGEQATLATEEILAQTLHGAARGSWSTHRRVPGSRRWWCGRPGNWPRRGAP